MPWCDVCSRFWNPSSIPPDGLCPSCGRTVAAPERRVGVKEPAGDGVNAPWHFKLLVGAVAAYLGWRGLQGVVWVVERLG